MRSRMQEERTAAFQWKIRIFLALFLGTVFFNVERRTFLFVAPSMAQEEAGLQKWEIGVLETALSLSFSLGKILGGVASDYYSNRLIFCVGLLIASLSNIFFGFSSSLYLFVLYWILNGLVQGGAGWPPAARLMTIWYPKNERGFWWSAVSTSQNVAGALTAILIPILAQSKGWRWAMIFPGVVIAFSCIWIWERLRDTPPDYVELGKPEESSKASSPNASVTSILFKYVLFNRSMWALSIFGLLQYLIKTGVSTWLLLFYLEFFNFTPVVAGGIVFWMEIGGIVGCAVAGPFSDRFFQKQRASAIYLFLIILSVAPLLLLLQSTSYTLNSIFAFILGFAIYGPQVLMGVLAVEICHKKATGTAIGLLGLFGGLGSSLAGYPTYYLIQVFQWKFFPLGLAFTSIASSIFLFLATSTNSGNKR